MRLYLSVKSPSEMLKKIANFVLTAYAPSWFIIKINPEAGCDPKNLHDILKFCSELSEDVFLIVKLVMQKNAYFAHLKNILTAMINDKKSYIRELG